MSTTVKVIAGLLLGTTLGLTAHAQSADTPAKTLGPVRESINYLQIEIKNYQDETLGRIADLGVDLVNGRIVELLVEPADTATTAGKVVPVPPLALVADPDPRIYRLDATPAKFNAAASIDLSTWEDAGRSERVTAAYHYFGQTPYFLEEGEAANRRDAYPKVSLGYVERLSKLMDLPVGNYQGEQFGRVSSLSLDILRGRLLSVIVAPRGAMQTQTVIPPMALDFNALRDALLLDESVADFADQPQLKVTAAAHGNEASSRQEITTGPRTYVALEQGDNARDMDRTLLIHQNLRLAKIYQRYVQVGSFNDRVTLRGWVRSADDHRRAGEIAAAAATLETVDNQLTVGRPLGANRR